MKTLLKLALFLLPMTVLAQAPQIPLTGNIGSGFNGPLINSPAVIFATDADHTMVYPEMSGSGGTIIVTSTPSLTATRNLIAPNTGIFNWVVRNNTTGGQSINVKVAGGTGVSIANGNSSVVMCDTVNCYVPGGQSVTQFLAPYASWPSWLVPTVTNQYTTPSLAVTAAYTPLSAVTGTAPMVATPSGSTVNISLTTVPITLGGTENNTASGGLANLGGSSNAIALVDTPIAVSSGSREPSGVKLPDGNLLLYSSNSGVISSQIGASDGSNWSSPLVVPPPTGYTWGYFSAVVFSGQLFITIDPCNTSTGYCTPAYMIGTIGGGDAITYSSPTSISIGQNYSYVGAAIVIDSTHVMFPVWYCGTAQPTCFPATSGVITGTYSSGWTFGAFVPVGTPANDPAQPSNGFNESTLLRYPNGDILDMMRGDLYGSISDEVGSYARALLPNGGTWSAPSYVLNVGSVGFPALALSSEGQTLFVGRGCLTDYCVSPTSGPTVGTISMDEGASFSTPSYLGFSNNDCYDALFTLATGVNGLAECHYVGATPTITYSQLSTIAPNFPNYMNYPGTSITFDQITSNTSRVLNTTSVQTTSLASVPNTASQILESWAITSNQALGFGSILPNTQYLQGFYMDNPAGTAPIALNPYGGNVALGGVGSSVTAYSSNSSALEPVCTTDVCLTSSGVSGMTQYGFPVAATSSTVTSSIQPSSWTTGHTFVPVYQPSGSPITPTIVDANTLNVNSALDVQCSLSDGCQNDNVWNSPWTATGPPQLAVGYPIVSGSDTTMTIVTLAGMPLAGHVVTTQGEEIGFTYVSSGGGNSTYTITRGHHGTPARAVSVGQGNMAGIISEVSACTTCGVYQQWGGNGSSIGVYNPGLTASFYASSISINAGSPITSSGPGGVLGTAINHAATDFEPALGNPGTNGYVLSSTTGGTRSWIAPTSGALLATGATTGATSQAQTFTDGVTLSNLSSYSGNLASIGSGGALSNSGIAASNVFQLPSLTSGSVLYSNGSTIAQDNSNFFWDATNHSLGIGTTAPHRVLEVNASSGDSAMRINAQSIGNAYSEYMLTSNTTNRLLVGIQYAGNQIFSGGGVNDAGMMNLANANLYLGTNGNTNVTVLPSGNVGIGTTNPGSLLTVNGGDVYVTTSANGIILKDTVTGTCSRIQLTSGALVPTTVTCPSF